MDPNTMWSFVLIVLIAFNGWLSITMINVQTRIAVVENNRFTASDGARMSAELIALRNRLPDKIPPDWFYEKVQRNEDRLSVVEDKVADDRAALKGIEKHLEQNGIMLNRIMNRLFADKVVNKDSPHE